VAVVVVVLNLDPSEALDLEVVAPVEPMSTQAQVEQPTPAEAPEVVAQTMVRETLVDLAL
jgi:hypothetical protein